MNINSNPTLLDYIQDPNKSRDFFSSLSQNAPSNALGNDIKTIQNRLTDDEIANTVKQIESGDTSLSLNRIGNMLSHLTTHLAAELSTLADDKGYSADFTFQQTEGQWTVSSDNPAYSQQAEQFQDWINRNSRLSEKLNQVNQLSEMYELGIAREFASELKSSGQTDSSVVAFLTETRQSIFTTNSLTLSSSRLEIGSQGMAEERYDALQKASTENEG